jgi:hypothetical protein
MSDLFAPATPDAAPAAPAAPAADTGAGSNDTSSTSEGRLSSAMDETLRATLKNITDGDDAAAAEGKAIADKIARGETVTDPGDIPGAPKRGPDGKFLPKDAADPTGVAPGKAAPATATAPDAGADALVRPPASWKPEAKATWESLPPVVRAEAHRREADFHNGIAAYKSQAQVAEILWSEVQPYEAAIRAAGTDVPGAMRSLFQTAAALQMGTPEQKAATMRGIAQTYGIDLRHVFAQQQNAPQAHPEFVALQNRVAAFERQEAQRQQQTLQSNNAAAMDMIREFGADPANKYFADVMQDMGALMQMGRAATMKDAYAMACNMNPSVRAALDKENEAARAAEALKAQRMARQQLSPTATPGAPAPAVGTMEESMRARYRELTAGN